MKLNETQWAKLVGDATVNVSPLTREVYKGCKVVVRKLDGVKYTVEKIDAYYRIFSLSQLRTFLTQANLPPQRKQAINKVLREKGGLA